MTDHWTLYDTAHLQRKERGDSVEFEGATGDLLGGETSGVYGVFVKDNRVMIVDVNEVEP